MSYGGDNLKRLIARELDLLHIPYHFEQRGRHPSVVINVDGQERFMPYSGSTGDYPRVRQNVLSCLRRLIREAREDQSGNVAIVFALTLPCFALLLMILMKV